MIHCAQHPLPLATPDSEATAAHTGVERGDLSSQNCCQLKTKIHPDQIILKLKKLFEDWGCGNWKFRTRYRKAKIHKTSHGKSSDASTIVICGQQC